MSILYGIKLPIALILTCFCLIGVIAAQPIISTNYFLTNMTLTGDLSIKISIITIDHDSYIDICSHCNVLIENSRITSNRARVYFRFLGPNSNVQILNNVINNTSITIANMHSSQNEILIDKNIWYKREASLETIQIDSQSYSLNKITLTNNNFNLNSSSVLTDMILKTLSSCINIKVIYFKHLNISNNVFYSADYYDSINTAIGTEGHKVHSFVKLLKERGNNEVTSIISIASNTSSTSSNFKLAGNVLKGSNYHYFTTALFLNMRINFLLNNYVGDNVCESTSFQFLPKCFNSLNSIKGILYNVYIIDENKIDFNTDDFYGKEQSKVDTISYSTSNLGSSFSYNGNEEITTIINQCSLTCVGDCNSCLVDGSRFNSELVRTICSNITIFDNITYSVELCKTRTSNKSKQLLILPLIYLLNTWSFPLDISGEEFVIASSGSLYFRELIYNSGRMKNNYAIGASSPLPEKTTIHFGNYHDRNYREPSISGSYYFQNIKFRVLDAVGRPTLFASFGDSSYIGTLTTKFKIRTSSCEFVCDVTRGCTLFNLGETFGIDQLEFYNSTFSLFSYVIPGTNSLGEGVMSVVVMENCFFDDMQGGLGSIKIASSFRIQKNTFHSLVGFSPSVSAFSYFAQQNRVAAPEFIIKDTDCTNGGCIFANNIIYSFSSDSSRTTTLTRWYADKSIKKKSLFYGSLIGVLFLNVVFDINFNNIYSIINNNNIQGVAIGISFIYNVQDTNFASLWSVDIDHYSSVKHYLGNQNPCTFENLYSVHVNNSLQGLVTNVTCTSYELVGTLGTESYNNIDCISTNFCSNDVIPNEYCLVDPSIDILKHGFGLNYFHSLDDAITYCISFLHPMYNDAIYHSTSTPERLIYLKLACSKSFTVSSMVLNGYSNTVFSNNYIPSSSVTSNASVPIALKIDSNSCGSNRPIISLESSFSNEINYYFDFNPSDTSTSNYINSLYVNNVEIKDLNHNGLKLTIFNTNNIGNFEVSNSVINLNPSTSLISLENLSSKPYYLGFWRRFNFNYNNITGGDSILLVNDLSLSSVSSVETMSSSGVLDVTISNISFYSVGLLANLNKITLIKMMNNLCFNCGPDLSTSPRNQNQCGTNNRENIINTDFIFFSEATPLTYKYSLKIVANMYGTHSSVGQTSINNLL